MTALLFFAQSRNGNHGKKMLDTGARAVLAH